MQALCRASGRRRTVGVHYFCDAAPLSEGGTPAVVFGPGDIAQAHTRDEWISLDSLDRGTAILAVDVDLERGAVEVSGLTANHHIGDRDAGGLHQRRRPRCGRRRRGIDRDRCGIVP